MKASDLKGFIHAPGQGKQAHMAYCLLGTSRDMLEVPIASRRSDRRDIVNCPDCLKKLFKDPGYVNYLFMQGIDARGLP